MYKQNNEERAKNILTRFVINMITFESRHKAIRSADIITRKAHNQYPHISPTKIGAMIGDDKVKHLFFNDMNFQYSMKMLNLRMKYENNEKKLYSTIIDGMKNLRIANCYEEAKMAELIGKVNGQNNIYSATLFYKKQPFHEVAIITDKEILPDKKCDLQGKSAIILDPWLNTTCFAGEYFTKLKTNFKKFFPELRNADGVKIKLKPNLSNLPSSYRIKQLKRDNPELIMPKFKKINLGE